MAADFLRITAQATLVLLVALAFGLDFATGVPGIVALIAISAFWGLAYSGVGFAIALKTGNSQATQSMWFLFMPLMFLTTLYAPKEDLSGWLAAAATINPVTYMLEGMRSLSMEGWNAGDIGGAVLTVVGVGAVTITLAFSRYAGGSPRGRREEGISLPGASVAVRSLHEPEGGRHGRLQVLSAMSRGPRPRGLPRRHRIRLPAVRLPDAGHQTAVDDLRVPEDRHVGGAPTAPGGGPRRSATSGGLDLADEALEERRVRAIDASGSFPTGNSPATNSVAPADASSRMRASTATSLPTTRPLLPHRPPFPASAGSSEGCRRSRRRVLPALGPPPRRPRPPPAGRRPPAARHAFLAAAVSRGTMCVSSVFGPTIHVIVPSVIVPAVFSITGASAATRSGRGFGAGTWACAFTLKNSPGSWPTQSPPATSGLSGIRACAPRDARRRGPTCSPPRGGETGRRRG